MASYRKYLRGCIYRFQFSTRLGSLWHFSIPCHLSRVENGSISYLRKLLIMISSPHTCMIKMASVGLVLGGKHPKEGLGGGDGLCTAHQKRRS